MSFKENYVENWKYKTIEYQGKKVFIVEEFVYEGIKYLYGAIEETIKKGETIECCFLYKVRDNVFANVEEDKKYNELLAYVAGKFVVSDIKKIFETK